MGSLVLATTLASCTSNRLGNEELLEGNIGVRLEIVSGNNQARSTNQIFTSELVVRAYDPITAEPVEGLTVQFQETTNTRAQIITPVVTTNSRGLAATKVRAGPATKTDLTIQARIADTNTAANFALRTLDSGMGTTFELTTTNAGRETAGVPFQFIVRVVDDSLRLVPEFNQVVNFQWVFEWAPLNPNVPYSSNGRSWGGTPPSLPPTNEVVQFTNGVYISPFYTLTDARAKARVFAGDGRDGLLDVFSQEIEVLPNTATRVGFATAAGGPDAGAGFHLDSQSGNTPDLVFDADQATPTAFHAVAIDDYGNYKGDITASWITSTVPGYANILQAYLSPSPPATAGFTSFTPTRSGRAKLLAASGALVAGERVVHVNHGKPSKLSYNIYDKAAYDGGTKTPISLLDAKLPVNAGKKFYVEVVPSDAKGNPLDQKYNADPFADSGAFSGIADVYLKWNQLPLTPVVSGGNTPSLVRENCTGASCDVRPGVAAKVTFVDGIPDTKITTYLNVATPGDATDTYPHAQLLGSVTLPGAKETITIPDSSSPKFLVMKGLPSVLNLYRNRALPSEQVFDTLRKAAPANAVFPGAVTPKATDPGPYGNTTQSDLRQLAAGEPDSFLIGVEDEGGNLHGFIKGPAALGISQTGGWNSSTPKAWALGGTTAGGAQILTYQSLKTADSTVSVSVTADQLKQVVPGYAGAALTTTFSGRSTPSDLDHFAINVLDATTKVTGVLRSTSKHYIVIYPRDQYGNDLQSFLGSEYDLTIAYQNAEPTYRENGVTVCQAPDTSAAGSRRYKIDVHPDIPSIPILFYKVGDEYVPAEFQLPKIGSQAKITLTDGAGHFGGLDKDNLTGITPFVIPSAAAGIRMERAVEDNPFANQGDVPMTLEVTCNKPFIFMTRTYDVYCNPVDYVAAEWTAVDMSNAPIASGTKLTLAAQPGVASPFKPPRAELEGILPGEAKLKATYTVAGQPQTVTTGKITFIPGILNTLTVTRDSVPPGTPDYRTVHETAGQSFSLTLEQTDCRGNKRDNNSGYGYLSVDIDNQDPTIANPGGVAKSWTISNTKGGDGKYQFYFEGGTSLGNTATPTNVLTFYNAQDATNPYRESVITITDNNNGAPITARHTVRVQNAAVDHFKIQHDEKWETFNMAAGSSATVTITGYDKYENITRLNPPTVTLSMSADKADANRKYSAVTGLTNPTGVGTASVSGVMTDGVVTATIYAEKDATITPSAAATGAATNNYGNSPTRIDVDPEPLVDKLAWLSASQTLRGAQTAGQDFVAVGTGAPAGLKNGAKIGIYDRFDNLITGALDTVNGDAVTVSLAASPAPSRPLYRSGVAVTPETQQVPLTNGVGTIDFFAYPMAPESVTLEIAYSNSSYIYPTPDTSPRKLAVPLTIAKGAPAHTFVLLDKCQTGFVNGVMSYADAVTIPTVDACSSAVAGEAMSVKIFAVDAGFNPVDYDSTSVQVKTTDTEATLPAAVNKILPGGTALTVTNKTANVNPMARNAPAASWKLSTSTLGTLATYDGASYKVVPAAPTQTVALLDVDTFNNQRLVPGKTGVAAISSLVANVVSANPPSPKAGTAYKVYVVLTDPYFNQVQDHAKSSSTLTLTQDDPSSYATVTASNGNNLMVNGLKQFNMLSVTASAANGRSVSCSAIADIAGCGRTFTVNPGARQKTIVFFASQAAGRVKGVPTRALSLPAPSPAVSVDANSTLTFHVIGVDEYYNQDPTFAATGVTLAVMNGLRANLGALSNAGGGLHTVVFDPAELTTGAQIQITAACQQGTEGADVCKSDPFNVTVGAATKTLTILPGQAYAPGQFLSSSAVTGTPTTATVGTTYTATVRITDNKFNTVATAKAGNVTPADPNLAAIGFTTDATGVAAVDISHRTASSNTGTHTAPTSNATVAHKLSTTAAGLAASLSSDYTVNASAATRAIIRRLAVTSPSAIAAQTWTPGKSDPAVALPPNTPAFTTNTNASSAFDVEILAVDDYFNIDKSFSTAGAVKATTSDVSDTDPSGQMANGFVRLTVSPVSAASQTIVAESSGLTELATGAFVVKHGDAKYLFAIHPEQSFDLSKGYTEPVPAGLPPPQISDAEPVGTRRAGVSFAATVRLTDRYGNAVTTAPDATRTVTVKTTDPNGPAEKTVTLANGTASVNLENQTEGTGYVVRASYGTWTTVDSSTYNVKPGPAAKVIAILPGQTHNPGKATLAAAVTPATPSAQKAGTSFTATVRLVDKYFNKIDPVEVADSYPTAEVKIETTDPQDVEAGYTGNFVDGEETFDISHVRAGSWTVKATVAKEQLGNPASDFTMTSGAYTVLGGTATHVITALEGQGYSFGFLDGLAQFNANNVITGSPTAKTAADAFTVTVRAVDDFMNVDPTFNGKVTIATPGDPEDTATGYSASFASGVKTFTVNPVRAAANQTVTVSVTNADDSPFAGVVHDSATYSIKEGPPAKLLIRMPGQTFTAGLPSMDLARALTGTIDTQKVNQAFDVELIGTDAEFNPIQKANYPDVNNGFTLSSSDGRSANVTGTLSDFGTATVSFTNLTGNDPLTQTTSLTVTPTSAISYPYTNSPVSYLVEAQPATKTIVLLGGQTYAAGKNTLELSPATIADVTAGAALAVTVVAVDDYHNRDYSQDNVDVALNVTGTANTITPATGAKLTRGATSFTVSSEKAEAKTVDATVAGVASVANAYTVKAAAPATLTLLEGHGASGAVTTSITTKLQVFDTYSNPVPGTTVAFSVQTRPAGDSSASVADASVTSSSSADPLERGTAGTSFTLGTKSGAYQMKATAGTATATFDFTADPERAAQFAFIMPEESPLVGETATVGIEARDQHGNRDTSFPRQGSPSIMVLKDSIAHGTQELGLLDLTGGYKTISVTHDVVQPVRLSFRDDLGIDEVIDISAQGVLTFKGPAVLTIDGGSPFDSGVHQIGATVRRTFTVTHTGDVPATHLRWKTDHTLAAPFHFSSDSYPGTATQPCPDDGTLAIGAQCKIAIDFRPTEDGLRSDFLKIEYDNGLVLASVEKELKGTGGKPGARDPAFNYTSLHNTLTDLANAVAIQADGKIIVAGTSRDGSGFDDYLIARYNRVPDLASPLADKLLDISFGTNGKTVLSPAGVQKINAVTVAPSGDIYFAGTSGGSGVIGKLTSAGALVAGFGAGGYVLLPAGSDLRAIQFKNDRIYVAGHLDGNLLLARVAPDSNGSLDTSFAVTGYVTRDLAGTTDEGFALHVDNTHAYVAGRSTDPGNPSVSLLAIAKWTVATGAIADVGTYGVGTEAVAYSMQVDGTTPGGPYIYLGGTVDGKFLVARLTSALALDTSFNGTGFVADDMGGTALGKALALDPAGQKPVLAGAVTAGPSEDLAVLRLNTDGSPDTSFNDTGRVVLDLQETGKDDAALAIALEPSLTYSLNGNAVTDAGKLVIVGRTVNASIDFAITRLFR